MLINFLIFYCTKKKIKNKIKSNHQHHLQPTQLIKKKNKKKSPIITILHHCYQQFKLNKKKIKNSLPGFSRLRMHTKGSQPGSIPVAFVEFQDSICAGSAMAALQGTFLLSSDRGAIRIEYAKSKMASDHIKEAQREVCVGFYFFIYN